MISSFVRINRTLQIMKWVYILLIYFPPPSLKYIVMIHVNDINIGYNNVAGVINQSKSNNIVLNQMKWKCK